MSTSGTGALIPGSQIVNQGYPALNGMNLTYLTASTFSVGAGQARDQSNTMDMLMGTSLVSGSGAGGTKVLANSTAVTVNTALRGAGGLDAGTIANSTLYSVFAIGDSRGFNAGSALISAVAWNVSPNMPMGYDSWRYIGSVATDGAAALRPFTQVGGSLDRTMHYQVPVAPGTPATAGSVAYASVGVLGTLTPAKKVAVLYGVSMDANTAGNLLYLAGFGNVAIASGGFESKLSSSVTTAPQHAILSATQALNATVYQTVYATTEASDAVTFLVAGYVDQL